MSSGVLTTQTSGEPRGTTVRMHRQAIRLGFQVVHRRSLVGRRYRELEHSQWRPREVVLDQQWQQLRRLVRHAYHQVPFYQQRMDQAGLHPDHLSSPDEYRRLPVLTRDELRTHHKDLVARDFPRNRLISNGSGGSTGSPVRFYHDATLVAGSQAAKLRNFRWAGWEPGDAWTRLWGSNFDVAAHKSVSGWLWERLTRVRWLSCFDMDEASMGRYAREMAQFRPEVIEAYVNPLYLFAQFLRARGLAGSIRPRGIIVSAEMLYDYHRQTIEDTFGCKVFNRYGCREVGDVAHECPSGRLHLNAETIYTEFLRDGRPATPGETAEIIVTPLDLYGMPMLRYRIEDLGSPATGDCPCGRSLPLMSMIQGRVQDLIITPSGRHLTGVFFAHLLKELDVERFQVIQDSIESLDFSIVPGTTWTSSQTDYVRRKLREYTDDNIELRVHLTSHIPLTPSGKYRMTLSRVRGPFSAQSIEEGHAL